MFRKSLFGFSYVSFWVLTWGTIGSLIDLPFLNSNIYEAGSIGQGATFVLTALISILLAIIIYPKVLENQLIQSFLGETNGKG